MNTTPVTQPLAERFAWLRTSTNACFFNALAHHLSPLENDPCVEMYFNYAITSNERGRDVARLLEQYVTLSNASFLDIGCAYAGFLVAFAERGARVLGIEIATHLIDLAKANLKDASFETEIMCKDATRLSDMVEHCNRIDIVTCNDVIEHVEDPYGLVNIISLILRPRGIAYFEIPNRYCPRFVLADGHYGLFGITLLDYTDAREYFSYHKQERIYDTRYYLELDQYKALFGRVGLDVTVLNESLEGVTLESVLNDIAHLKNDYEKLLGSVPALVRNKVSTKLSQYLREIDSAPRSSKEERQHFLMRYGPSFWRVLGRKL